MHRLIFMMISAAVLFILYPSISNAQPHLANSLLVHLDLDLDKSAISPTNVQVRIHATDRINDTYYASQVDPEEDENDIEWNQDLPLMIDSNVPMRLIFHVNTTDGSPLPQGYAVQWQYSLDGSGSQDMTGNAVLIPAGSSGDMNLTVQGSVAAQ